MPPIYTDIVRGVAIILVIICHMNNRLGVVRIFTPFGGIAVSLFLLLSGYGLNESYKRKGLNGYWIKKIVRIFLPYAIFISVLTLSRQDMNITSYFLDVLAIKTSLWYVEFLFRWYLVFWLIKKYVRQYALCAFFLFGVIMFFISESPLEREQVFAFPVGVAISYYSDRLIHISKEKYEMFAICCFVLGCAFLVFRSTAIVHNSSILYTIVESIVVLSYGICLLIALYPMKALYRSLFLKIVGAASFELYIIHSSFMTTFPATIGYGCLYIGLCVLTAYLFYGFNTQIIGRLSTK